MAEEQTDMFDDLDDEQERAEIERLQRATPALQDERPAANRQFQDDLRAGVLYTYRCPECGHSGHVRRAGDQPEEPATCTACGAAVTAEWDGGVELVPAAPAPQARGGAREGAGRRPKSPVAASKVVRIPEQYEAAVRALVAHLDASAKLGRHYGPTTSDPVFVRSLYGKAQHVTFTVAPLKP